ncbi:ABC transporter permease [Rhodovarius lipocyclicus]|uniref:ABC transporter permease n=1 Tax=Rhodovarius lipocyclicus TaxID=268410 RepID=UPI00135ADC60|nr:ABC transporter permease [Rhodovarius lipocyclicus]
MAAGVFTGRRARRAALTASAGLGLGFILLPLLLVMWLAFFRQEIPSFPPQGYTLRWFAAVPANRSFASGFLLSVQVSVVATFIGVALAVPASLALVRGRLPLKPVMNTLLMLPLVVPGVVLGAAIYVGELETELATEWPVLGSVTGLIAAHTLIVIPWAVRLVTASLSTLNPVVEEAAKNLGATPWVTFRRVTLPAIRPGLVAGALFGFVTSFGNLEASLFLVGPGQTTLPIAILQYLAWKIDPTVAAVSLLQIVVIAVAMLITDRFVKLSQVV